jgi:ribosomal protein L1
VEEAAEIMSQQTDTLGFENLAYGCNINLNLEALSKRPSHKLRGVFDLPHGTGRKVPVLALHNGEDQDLTVSCLLVGASFAGNLCDALTSSKILPLDYSVLVATTDMREETNRRGKRLARLLKRSNLTPNEEMKTLVEKEDLVETVKKYANGNYARFKAAQDGNVPCCLGKLAVHTPEQIKENLYEVLRHLFAIQPSDFGTGRFAQKKNRKKYVLGMHIHAKGIGSYPLDMAKVLTDLFETRMRMIQTQGGAFWSGQGKNEPRENTSQHQLVTNSEYNNVNGIVDPVKKIKEKYEDTMIWNESTQTWIKNKDPEVEQNEEQYKDDDEDLSWISSDSEDDTRMDGGDDDDEEEEEEDRETPDEDESDFHDDEESDDDVFDDDDEEEEEEEDDDEEDEDDDDDSDSPNDEEKSDDGTSMEESSGSDSDDESFK